MNTKLGILLLQWHAFSTVQLQSSRSLQHAHKNGSPEERKGVGGAADPYSLQYQRTIKVLYHDSGGGMSCVGQVCFKQLNRYDKGSKCG